MGAITCCQTDGSLPNFGRPNSVNEMRKVAFFVVFRRFQNDGTRNTIDLTSPTLGQDIVDRTKTTTAADQRFHVLPQAEEPTWERTDTEYKTYPSGKKVKLPGVGNIRTVAFKTVEKDAVSQIFREAKGLTCQDFDFVQVTIDGYIWGIMDSPSDTVLRGYETGDGTYDVFKNYATDSEIEELMFSWDLDRFECEEKAYPITNCELDETSGVNALKDLTGLISGFQALSAIDATHTQSIIEMGFVVTAGTGKPIVGLVAANFTLFNVTTALAVAVVGVVESDPGVSGIYSIEYADLDVTPGDELRVTVINADPFDVEVKSYSSTL